MQPGLWELRFTVQARGERFTQVIRREVHAGGADVTPLLLPVVAASLVGSLHCAGMCGPFTAFYAGNDTSRGRARASGHLAYHLGRLLTYAILGALAGTLGRAIDLAGSAAGVGRVAGLLAGAAMILWALLLLLEHAGVSGLRLAAPARLRTLALGARFARFEGARPWCARA